MKEWFGGVMAWVCMAICLIMIIGAVIGFLQGYSFLAFVAVVFLTIGFICFKTRHEW